MCGAIDNHRKHEPNEGTGYLQGGSGGNWRDRSGWDRPQRALNAGPDHVDTAEIICQYLTTGSTGRGHTWPWSVAQSSRDHSCTRHWPPRCLIEVQESVGRGWGPRQQLSISLFGMTSMEQGGQSVDQSNSSGHMRKEWKGGCEKKLSVSNRHWELGKSWHRQKGNQI